MRLTGDAILKAALPLLLAAAVAVAPAAAAPTPFYAYRWPTAAGVCQAAMPATGAGLLGSTLWLSAAGASPGVPAPRDPGAA